MTTHCMMCVMLISKRRKGMDFLRLVGDRRRVGVGANQVLGFVLLWGAVFVLGYLNAKAPAPDTSAPAVGAG